MTTTTSSQTTTSERLRAKLAPFLAELSARSQLIASHPDAPAAYRELVRMLYSIIRASVPIMVAARAESERREGDSVAEGLVAYLDEHIEEERHHDEWMLEDWEKMGGDPEELVAWPGTPTIAQAVGSAYYWTLHAHPVAILGYCTVLEGSPPSEKLIEGLASRTGYAAGSFDTLRHHSDADPHHSGDLYAVMDSLALTSWHESIIGMTALQTADLLIAASDELLASLGDG